MKNLLIIGLFLLLTGCYRHSHTYGNGPYQKDMVVDVFEKKHWYVLYGTLDLSPVDIDAVIKDNQNCKVETETKFVDGVVGFFTGLISIAPRTVRFYIPYDRNTDKGRELLERQRKIELKKAMKEEAKKRTKISGNIG